MKKVLIYLTALTMLTACGSDIEYTEPDNKTNEIQFSVASIDAPGYANQAKAVSRAGEHKHIAWNDVQHANTLGVFGFCDGNLSNVIFDNQKVTYSASKWVYKPAKYWPEFSQYTSFDFFGYMVENADPSTATLPDAAKVTKDANKYTLSFAANLEKPILTSPDNTPLICHAPYHATVVGMPIPFQMDQTLTGYDIQFQLGEKMSKLRYFVIKSVKVYGDNLPVGGTVSRTYTLTDGKWSETQAPVTWSVPEDKKVTVSATSAVAITSEAKTISSSTDWVKWGGATLGAGAFYAIPHADFTPTIEVTYDVYAKDDLNSDESTITRKEVTSTIVFNKSNFDALKSGMGTTGEIQHINIKIVPDYLYVLSDDDQVTGFLIATK